MSDAWIPASWPAPDGVVAGTTLRHGGISEGRYRSLNLGAFTDDEPAAVEENRRRFRAICDLPAEPRWLRQVHGSVVVIEPPAMQVAEADASITRQAGVVCAVLTADCLPVLFVSADGAELAAAHAGWRGLAAGVLEATVSAMTADPADILVWLGPGISQAAFEVGAEVRQQYVGQDPETAAFFAGNVRGRWQADLFGLARLRLANAGVGSISGGDYCTHRDAERFFSHRRDGDCGRMASFVFRRK